MKKLSRRQVRKLLVNETRTLMSESNTSFSNIAAQGAEAIRGIEPADKVQAYEEKTTLGRNKKIISGRMKTEVQKAMRKYSMGTLTGSTRVLIFMLSEDKAKVYLLDPDKMGIVSFRPTEEEIAEEIAAGLTQVINSPGFLDKLRKNADPDVKFKAQQGYGYTATWSGLTTSN